MKYLEQLLETPEPFTKWLSKNKGMYVGAIQEPESCPLAVFLKDQTGELAIVDTDEIRLLDNEGDDIEAYEVPSWALDFIKEIDQSNNDIVTAERCLECL